MSKTLTEIRSLARSHTDTALSALAGIAQNGQSESARVAASVALLDRGWGKPTQPLSGSEDDEPIKLLHRIERVIVNAPNTDG
jgi:hypothetical protein